MTPLLLRIGEAGEVVGLSARTIRRALHDPRLPLRHYKFGSSVRIAPDDLRAWADAHRAMPAPVPRPVLNRLSPAARDLLSSFSTPGAPGRQKASQIAADRLTPGQKQKKGG